jgi:hypothetical protein
MKAMILALGLAILGGSSDLADESAHRYQLIAVEPGGAEYGFVDAASVERADTSVTYWWLSIYEPPAVMKNGPAVLYQTRQRMADCAHDRTRDLIVMARYQNGDERWISLVSRFRPVVPGSVGESELKFVCDGTLPEARLPAFDTIEAASQFAKMSRRLASATPK